MDDIIATKIWKMDLTSEESQKNPIDVVKSGNVEDFKHLLKAELDLETKDDSGNTLLHLACINEHLDIVNLLLDHGANIRSKNDIFNTPLHEAAKSGNIDILRIFLKKKVFINGKNDEGETPLHFACLYGHLPLVTELVDKSANVYIKDVYNKLPFHYAIREGHEEIMNYFLKSDDFKFNSYVPLPLHYAIKHQQYNIINVLIDQYSVDINAQDDNWDTPLHFAVRKGDLKIIDQLLLKGAMINIKNNSKSTPLHDAIKEKNFVAVEKLLLSSADVKKDFRNDYLSCAAKYDDKNILRLLLEFEMSDLRYALKNAVEHNSHNIVEFLSCRFGKNKSENKDVLNSALFDAIEIECLTCVKLLLKFGATTEYLKYNRSTGELLKEVKSVDIRNLFKK